MTLQNFLAHHEPSFIYSALSPISACLPHQITLSTALPKKKCMIFTACRHSSDAGTGGAGGPLPPPSPNILLISKPYSKWGRANYPKPLLLAAPPPSIPCIQNSNAGTGKMCSSWHSHQLGDDRPEAIFWEENPSLITSPLGLP